MRPLKIPIRRPWIPYIILIISLLLTCLSTLYVSQTVRSHEQLRFQNIVQQIEDSIDNRLETYIALLRSGAGLFTVQPNLSREAFADYIKRIDLSDNYLGIQGFGYAKRVNDENKEQFNKELQVIYADDNTITPEGSREVYYPVTYLQPETPTSLKVIGYDMFSSDVRKSAMEHARDSGDTFASRKVILAQQTANQKEPGFLIYTPLYEGGVTPKTVAERREKITGFVYSAFRINNFLKGVFGDPNLPLVNYKVYDGTEKNDANLLYNSAIQNKQSDPKEYRPRFETERQLTNSGQTWTITLATRPAFDDALQEVIAPAIFIGGLLISLTLFLLSRAEYVARSKAEQAADDLQSSQKQLQKAVGLRDNFISIASHELKTPVTSLKVYAEVLFRQFKQTDDITTTDYLSKMNKQLDKLTILIQDLLDVTRLQAGRLAFREEQFSIEAMIKEVVDNTQQITKQHTIVIKNTTTRQMIGDQDRLGQVVNNLLTNAIKYSPKADKVYVHVKETKTATIISVEDFGIGIDKKHQEKIFSRFYRVTDTDERTFPGLGIGLYICNEIVKRHNGKIIIKSVKGKGSIFSIMLPYKKL